MHRLRDERRDGGRRPVDGAGAEEGEDVARTRLARRPDQIVGGDAPAHPREQHALGLRERGGGDLVGAPHGHESVRLSQRGLDHGRVGEPLHRAHGERGQPGRGGVGHHRLVGGVPLLHRIAAGQDPSDGVSGALGQVGPGGQRPQRIVRGLDGDDAAVLQAEAEADHGWNTAAQLHPAEAQPAARALTLEAAEKRRQSAFGECALRGLVLLHPMFLRPW